MRILILGGTAEASALIRQLTGDREIETTLSLAGRTTRPAPHGVPTRVGGFGGTDGLARWIRDESIEAVIDATHPFAARISANAHAATSRLNVPLCTIVRPPWTAVSGDRWQTVANIDAAAETLGPQPRRVFLSVGRQGLSAFSNAPRHTYIARVIEPPDAGSLPPNLTLLTDRGPLRTEHELDLLRRERIDVVVSKNSGGSATYAKIEAARRLRIPVVMIARPHKATGYAVTNAADAVLWLSRLHAQASLSERGV